MERPVYNEILAPVRKGGRFLGIKIRVFTIASSIFHLAASLSFVKMSSAIEWLKPTAGEIRVVHINDCGSRLSRVCQ